MISLAQTKCIRPKQTNKQIGILKAFRPCDFDYRTNTLRPDMTGWISTAKQELTTSTWRIVIWRTWWHADFTAADRTLLNHSNTAQTWELNKHDNVSRNNLFRHHCHATPQNAAVRSRENNETIKRRTTTNAIKYFRCAVGMYINNAAICTRTSGWSGDVEEFTYHTTRQVLIISEHFFNWLDDTCCDFYKRSLWLPALVTHQATVKKTAFLALIDNRLVAAIHWLNYQPRATLRWSWFNVSSFNAMPLPSLTHIKFTARRQKDTVLVTLTIVIHLVNCSLQHYSGTSSW